MHWPGVRQLWIAIRRKDIDVTKKQVEELVKTRGEKQVFGSLQKAEGKSLAKDVDVRWQMDLADLKNQNMEHKTKAGESYSAILVCIDCFSRQVWAKALKQKTQEEVKAKLSQIFAAAGHKPKVISSDNGQEFRGVLSEYLDEKLVVQRYKSVGDVNALGLVDRAIQQLKLKISEILSTRADKTWVDVLPDAVKALNSYPKDVLHGAAPKQVLGNPPGAVHAAGRPGQKRYGQHTTHQEARSEAHGDRGLPRAAARGDAQIQAGRAGHLRRGQGRGQHSGQHGH